MGCLKLQTTSNGFEPSRRKVIAGFSLSVVSGCLMLQGCTSNPSGDVGLRPRSEVSAQPLQFDVSEGLAKLNQLRAKRGLAEFQIDPRLQEAAQRHANLMGVTGKYGHDIGRGTDFKTRIFSAGFNQSAGENIGVGYGSVDEAIQGWLESPGHRKNMLKSRYTLAGLAYAFNTSGRNDRYTHFWVLIMGAKDGEPSHEKGRPIFLRLPV